MIRWIVLAKKNAAGFAGLLGLVLAASAVGGNAMTLVPLNLQPGGVTVTVGLDTHIGANISDTGTGFASLSFQTCTGSARVSDPACSSPSGLGNSSVAASVVGNALELEVHNLLQPFVVTLQGMLTVPNFGNPTSPIVVRRSGYNNVDSDGSIPFNPLPHLPWQFEGLSADQTVVTGFSSFLNEDAPLLFASLTGNFDTLFFPLFQGDVVTYTMQYGAADLLGSRIPDDIAGRCVGQMRFQTGWLPTHGAGCEGTIRVEFFTVSVPEPGTFALFAMAVAGLVVRRRLN